MRDCLQAGKVQMNESIAYFVHEISSRIPDACIEIKNNESFFVRNKKDLSKVIEVWLDKDDPRRCFAKYKKLTIKRNGDRHIKTSESSRMVSGGLIWVIEQVFKYGYIKPEFE